MSVVTDWDNDYARIARAASQLRLSSFNNSNSPYNKNKNNKDSSNPAINKESILTGLDRLTNRLRNLEQSRTLSVQDLARRRTLVQNLSQQLISGQTNQQPQHQQTQQQQQLHLRKHKMSANPNASVAPLGTGYPPPQTTNTSISSALRQQDDMLGELATGVGKLKDQSKLIGEEAKMHVHLLDQVDEDVEKAQGSMESETLRALKLKEDKSVWRLQLTIVCLSILLFILVLSGLS